MQSAPGGGGDVDVGFLGIVTANLDMCGCYTL